MLLIFQMIGNVARKQWHCEDSRFSESFFFFFFFGALFLGRVTRPSPAPFRRTCLEYFFNSSLFRQLWSWITVCQEQIVKPDSNLFKPPSKHEIKAINHQNQPIYFANRISMTSPGQFQGRFLEYLFKS